MKNGKILSHQPYEFKRKSKTFLKRPSRARFIAVLYAKNAQKTLESAVLFGAGDGI